MKDLYYEDSSLQEAIEYLEYTSQRDDSENSRFTSFMVSLAKPFDYSKFQKEENQYVNMDCEEPYSYEDFEEADDENILLVELANKMPCVIKDVNEDGFITSDEIEVKPQIRFINQNGCDCSKNFDGYVVMAESEYNDLLS